MISGDDVEVAGKAGKVQPLSLSMTELVTADNTQILLPNGRVWGAANTRADRILRELAQRLPHRCSGATYRLRHEGPRCRQSTAPILELTVSAKAKPSEAGAVKQCVLDHASALLAAA
ncbi:hypothetical protein UNPF46_13505 [Bradyrhizobium sp. UNPF46]|uniref:mechanosensitive ion channel domain-containing protein n=1 Tax=Bradyrhizobium sp. UNPF46 TaxID=1141168 RepID=UPI001151BB5E|nr:mechanosensitive ion channel domain-containing protein [Bradyrhizobium sp. UNPF46]TQF39403.1 hypothetical protein UNPF46_13505 [Bradyrhizobium sp. UNPF46]